MDVSKLIGSRERVRWEVLTARVLLALGLPETPENKEKAIDRIKRSMIRAEVACVDNMLSKWK